MLLSLASVLGLELSLRTHLKSLALALKVESLALALALALKVGALALALKPESKLLALVLNIFLLIFMLPICSAAWKKSFKSY